MGCSASSLPANTSSFQLIPDKYGSYEEVAAALRNAGLERSQLIVGVDFTRSNLETGKRSFGGRCMHDVSDPSTPNPYCQALSVIAKALWDFDNDHIIPAYGFGDAHTGCHALFSFQTGDKPCKGLVRCLERYQEIAKVVTLWGPTSFAPLIRQAIKLVRETNEYHILLIVADGQVSVKQVQETQEAIIEASSYPLSIVMVGVGDGPWQLMENFDDELPQRRFDNFQFVAFEEVAAKYPWERCELAFATHALMEVPEQYRAVKKLGLLRKGRRLPEFQVPLAPFGPPDLPADPKDPWYDLPEGWDAMWEGAISQYYYLNISTGESSWKRPGGPKQWNRSSITGTDTPSTDASSCTTSTKNSAGN